MHYCKKSNLYNMCGHYYFSVFVCQYSASITLHNHIRSKATGNRDKKSDKSVLKHKCGPHKRLQRSKIYIIILTEFTF